MIKTRHNNVLAGLPKAFCNKCETLLNESIVGKQQLMQHKYNMGLLMKEAYVLELKSSIPIDVSAILREYFHYSSKRPLDRVYRLVCIFTRAEVEDLMQPTKDGYCIGWGHFDFAMVDYLSKDQMIYYLKMARDRRLCSKAMYNIIKEDNDRIDDPQNRKQIKSASQFIESMQKYMDLCEENDSLLDNVPQNVIQQGVKAMDPLDKEDLLKQVDDHLMFCFLLKRKLQD